MRVPSSPMVRFVILSSVCMLAALGGEARAGDDVELGPDVGIASRPAQSGYGVRYGSALAYGAHVQIPLASWMRVTTYYAHTAQNIEIDAATFGPAAPKDDLVSYVLGARIQPTFSPSNRLHLWLDVGAAWGIMTAPPMRVSTLAAYEVGARGDAFGELPLGIGGELDVMPPWVGVTVDFTAGPVFGGFDPSSRAQVVDASGKLVEARSLPRFASSWTAMLALVAKL